MPEFTKKQPKQRDCMLSPRYGVAGRGAPDDEVPVFYDRSQDVAGTSTIGHCKVPTGSLLNHEINRPPRSDR